jgi:hypothetical protein
VIAAVVVVAVLAGQGPERATLLVLDPVSDDDDRALAAQVAVAVSTVAARDDRARVYSAADVQQMAALAAEQQLTGCASSSCLAEMGGALGARYVVFGTLRTVAGQRRIELRLFDVERGEIMARVDGAARDRAALLDAAPSLASTLLEAVFPRPPLWQRPLFVAGAVTAGAGLVTGVAGGAAAGWYDAVARDAGSSGGSKDDALGFGPVALVVAGVGGAAVVAGVVIAAVGAAGD